MTLRRRVRFYIAGDSIQNTLKTFNEFRQESDPDFRHKRALFKELIDTLLLPLMHEAGGEIDGSIIKRFNAFVSARRTAVIDQLYDQKAIDREGFQVLYEDFIYRALLPDIASLLSLLKVKPMITYH